MAKAPFNPESIDRLLQLAGDIESVSGLGLLLIDNPDDAMMRGRKYVNAIEFVIRHSHELAEQMKAIGAGKPRPADCPAAH